MAALPAVVLVKCDDGDWEGLYVDGRLVSQGHEVRLEAILAAFGIPPIPSVWTDDEWLAEVGELPSYLSDVKQVDVSQ